jgi:CubicO group peptidase (beta-lactamase class C family)
MARQLEIHGDCAPQFEGVREAFAQLFAAPSEVGGAVAIQQEGRMVVDLWAGHADAARSRPWQRDTLVNVFSTTKGMTALCAHRLADRGELDLDAPASRYWPEFAQGGKGALSVRALLNHSAGLPAIRRPLPPHALFEWEAPTDALASQETWWEPGTRHGYHALTFGWLVGELIRRVSGRSVGRFFQEEIAGPLRADVHIGTGPTLDDRVAEIVPAPPPEPGEVNPLLELLKNPTSVAARAFLNPALPPDVVNTTQWRRAEIPAANGHASARGLAQVYGAAASPEHAGTEVLASEGVKRAGVEERSGPDLILFDQFVRYGPGFMLGTPDEPLGPNPGAFGHSGAGGSLAFADPAAKLGFAYVMNQMQLGRYLIGPRANALVETLYTCL